MAVLAAANVVVFVLIAEDVLNGGGLVSHDQAVLNWFVDNRTDGLIHAAKVVSTLGSFVSLTIMATLLGLWLWRRGWQAGLAAAPLVSLVLASLASTVAKSIFGRARPPMSVHAEHVSLKAFPSGHATDAAAFFLSADSCSPSTGSRTSSRAGCSAPPSRLRPSWWHGTRARHAKPRPQIRCHN